MTVRVIYVAGNGRSGSTLLDRVLGQVPGAVSLGEVRFTWQFGFVQNNLCECGVAFRDCSFWSSACHEAFGEIDETRARELADQSRRLLWTPAIGRIAGWLPMTGARRLVLDEHVDLLGRLYRAIAGQTGADWLIDSSKLASHALLLDRIEDLELHVVHLVRDSRALAFSWKRKRLRPEVTAKKQHMPIRPAYLTALRWNLHNFLSQRLARVAKTYHRVRYEDFVRSPAETLQAILGRLGCDRPLDFVSGDEVDLSPGHTVAGNPSRFAHGPVRIRVDDEWKREMPATDKALVTALTLPQLLAYGYRVGGSRAVTAPMATKPPAEPSGGRRG